MLRYSRKKEHCHVLGPGDRAVIWFHGCSKNCPGCIAREMNNSTEETSLSPEELYTWLKGIEGIEGVTLSGGEPFEQNPEDLAVFLKMIKESPQNLSVIIFTGKYLEDIKCDEKLAPLLSYVDIIVDGPYDESLNDGTGLRGSNNQNIHFLTERYGNIKKELMRSSMRKLELELTADGELEMSGIPEKGFMKKFMAALEKEGCTLR